MNIEEIYISVDVEADGKIPGRNSMTAVGAVVAGYRTRDGQQVKVDPFIPQNRFYAEIRPISDEWEPEALAVGLLQGFDQAISDPTGELKRAYLTEHGQTPESAMEGFTAWVRDNIKAYDAKGAVFIGYPVVYDWMWVYWYMISFTVDGSPFGHSRAADIKTAFATKANKSILSSVKARIPRYLKSKLPHTHLAVDDAAEQGQLGMNILNWNGSSDNITEK